MSTAAIQAVAKERPYGTVTVNAVRGGIEIPTEQGSDVITVASAACDRQSG